MVALLSNVDPFMVWHLVLLALAISASARLGRGRGAVLAIAIWAILTGLRLIPVAIGAALTGQMTG
jgi:FtsH-binding integral membrane protein